MDNASRTAILARVSQAQLKGYIPDSPKDLPNRLTPPAFELEVVKARLCSEFALLGVDVFVEESAQAVCDRVKGLVTGKSILSWDANQLPYGLGQCLENETVSFGRDTKEKHGEAEIGLTGCEAALAETGTLAMVSSAGKPRTASLLPYVHVAVIRSSDILPGMGEFFERFKDQAWLLPYLVFITGPSRTADIELSLTLGVHGPGKVIVLIGP